jgi:hypothetical protein
VPLELSSMIWDHFMLDGDIFLFRAVRDISRQLTSYHVISHHVVIIVLLSTLTLLLPFVLPPLVPVLLLRYTIAACLHHHHHLVVVFRERNQKALGIVKFIESKLMSDDFADVSWTLKNLALSDSDQDALAKAIKSIDIPV